MIRVLLMGLALFLLAEHALAVEAGINPTTEPAAIDFEGRTMAGTTDGSIAKIRIEQPGLYRINCRYLANEPGSARFMFFERRALARRTAGAVQVAGVQTVGTDIGAQGWQATLAANGESVEAQVTGEAGKTIKWRVRCDVDSW